MRHKRRMAAIETEANAKIRKSFIGRSRPMRGNNVPGDLVYYWRAGTSVHQAQGQWLGPARVIGNGGGNIGVSHRATAVKDPRQQQFQPEPAQEQQTAPRQEPAHQRQESRPNQESQQTRQKQRVRMQDDSDDGRGKRPRVVESGSQKMETEQEPESDLLPVLEDDDLNATVIEVMTDIEVLLDGSSVIDVFAVSSARRKGVEVSERKMTESDRKLLRKAKELELQSWLDHRVFDLVKKKFVDQERIMRARWVLTWKSSGKAKARLCVLGFQDPDLTEVSRDSPTLSAASEALIMQWVASHKYRLISGDIKTAFLSGDEDVRNIFISPPDDVRQMLNVDHETVLRLRKAVYGLVNAPKKWWDRLKKSLIQHGFTSCALDPCAFVLRMSGKNHWSARCACR